MTEHWTQALDLHWVIKATLQPLAGEYDLNFLAQSSATEGAILKVMRPDCPPELVALQVAALNHLADGLAATIYPKVITTKQGAVSVYCEDADGNRRLLWLLQHLPGRSYAQSLPKTPDLVANLGRAIGTTDLALENFYHPALDRDFKWNLMQALWIEPEISAISDPKRRQILSIIVADFASVVPHLKKLRQQAVHNDINDYNILVTDDFRAPSRVSGLIDLGDMCLAPRICDLAIAAAYVVLDHPNPETALEALVAGYHAENPLKPVEIDLIWPLLQMRLAVSVVNSTLMALTNPSDPYVVVSQADAWLFLEKNNLHARFLQARLRAACGLPVTAAAAAVQEYLNAMRGNFAHVIYYEMDDEGKGLEIGDLSQAPMGSLSVEASVWPKNPFEMPAAEAGRVGEEFSTNFPIWLGYYKEPRLIYTSPTFQKGPWRASDRRTVHLGIDIFAPQGTAVSAPLAGRVHAVENRTAALDYGGIVILSHETPSGDYFYTLYGHLDPEVCDRLAIGQSIQDGSAFCRLGDKTQNGGWAPHLHFQLALTIDGIGEDWPGVADPDELWFWTQICPNPAALLNLPDEKTAYVPTDKAQVLLDRRAHFGDNLVLSYADPVMFLRGWKHHLFDEWGRSYLDAYNNVPHVGHSHPRIQAVAADQLKRMNSNTRYLHPARTAFAQKILSKLPVSLEVCYFVNSGSEANELALRLVRAHTSGKGMVTPDHGYFGNTNGAVEISAYKFNAPGGIGQSDWVELVDVADDYRGKFQRDDPDRTQKFADQVDQAVDRLAAKNITLAGWIAETFPSVGGQIIPPHGYLDIVYAKIRAAGGLCIADEVQTGLGRLGEYYFGFEYQDVVPDMVVLGKPIGNGHPIGIVITTRAIADSFAKGPEFFSTFGGSVLSCRIGKEVLDIIEDEGLQENARAMGGRLLSGLRRLQNKHLCIGDVRGMGLFIGVELVTDQQSKTQATDLSRYVKNRMRAHRILLGSEGPQDNILKIRPPLTIAADDIDMILTVLDHILLEVA
ncbi:MAG: aminotransferase class III-fold pyridoxal phosphate-dependent enzyme [Paracoccaceae bacterium]|nr:aminotransferase class III-fold pyridoxal phosphate-dependent enzyme [Paracoccaceae bacterium]